MNTETKAYKEALGYMKKYQKVIGEMSKFKRGSDAWLRLETKLRQSVPPGIYRHFKSSNENEKLYAVIGVSGSTESDEVYTVQYVALYSPHHGRLTGRPLFGESGFLTPIKREEYTGERFTLIKNLTVVEIAMSLS